MRINDFFMKEVETRDLMADNAMITLFTKLRVMVVFYRKQFQMGLFLNLAHVLVVTSFLLYTDHKYIENMYKSNHIFMLVNFLLNIGGLIVKTVITIYFYNHLYEEQTLDSLREKTSILVKSRVFGMTKRIGVYLNMVNFFLLFISTPFAIFYDSPVCKVNAVISWVFIIRMYFYIQELKDIATEPVPARFIHEIMIRLKDKTYSSTDDNKYKDCIFCLDNYKDGEKIKELNCDGRHIFHEECIINWLKIKDMCPICKKLN